VAALESGFKSLVSVQAYLEGTHFYSLPGKAGEHKPQEKACASGGIVGQMFMVLGLRFILRLVTRTMKSARKTR
jgi:hypothetical protein